VSETTDLGRPLAGLTPPPVWLVALTGLSGSMPVVMAAAMSNIAVPSIMGAYGVGQNQAQWASTAFVATMVVSQLLNAWASRALGRRTAFMTAIGVFFVGGVISATAPGIEVLIAGRVLQGAAAGVLQATSLISIVTAYPAARRRFAVSLFGTGQLLALGIGPVIGGMVIDGLAWPYAFLAPLPLLAIGLLLAPLAMPGRDDETPAPAFDWAGFGLCCLVVFCLVGTLGNGHRLGWGSLEILLMMVTGTVALTAFILVETIKLDPVLDVSLFRDVNFAAVVGMAAMFGFTSFAFDYGIPVMVQTVQGLTPTSAGLLVLPGGLLLMGLMPLGGWLADRLPTWIPLLLGFCINGVAALGLSTTDVNTPTLLLFAYVTTAFFSWGLIIPALAGSVIAHIPADRINQGIAAYNFTRQLGGSLGIAVMVLVIDVRTAVHAEALAATQTAGNPFSRELLAKVERLLHEGGLAGAHLKSGALDYLGRVVHAQATTFGFQDAFLALACMFVIALVPAWFVARATDRSGKR